MKCVFELDGTITSVALKCDGSFPASSYADSGGGTGSNTWYHPIARRRAAHTTKSSVNSFPNQPYPDSGEELAYIHNNAGRVVPGDFTIAQLTNTHLVGQQQCIDVPSVGKKLIWKLVPGPGAVTGAGA